MTLICAVKCREGIVLGSDGQASIASVGGAIKHKIRKIQTIGDNTIFAASGTIGLIQKSLEVILPHTKDFDSGLTTKSLESVKMELFPVLRGARDAYVSYAGKEEGIPTVSIALCGLDTKRKLRLWHMAGDTHDEFIDVVGCYCSGNGETVGYALLKSFVPEDPTIAMGHLVIYRTLKDAINTLASGLGEPIDIWHMKNDGSIRRLGNGDMNRLAKAYKAWKTKERQILNG